MRIKSIIISIIYAIVILVGFFMGFALGFVIMAVITGTYGLLLLVISLLVIGGSISSFALLQATRKKSAFKAPRKKSDLKAPRKKSALKAVIDKKKIIKGDIITVTCKLSNLDFNLREPEITYVEGIFAPVRVQYQIITNNPDSNGILLIFKENDFFKLYKKKFKEIDSSIINRKVQPLLFEQRDKIYFIIEFYGIEFPVISLNFLIFNINRRILDYLENDIYKIFDLDDRAIEDLKFKSSGRPLSLEFIFEGRKKGIKRRKYWKLVTERFYPEFI